jgi:hypothetical protein
MSVDCFRSSWFPGNLEPGVAFRAVVDLGVTPQPPPEGTSAPVLFLPETFTEEERRELPGELRARTSRDVPWCTVGFATPERARLLDETARCLGAGGVAFLPRHRPYGTGSWTLEQEALERLYGRCELSIWTSHHGHAYLEPLRALLAVRRGCVPVKIEPRWHRELAAVPWVHASVESARRAISALGPVAMLERCYAYIDRMGSFERAASRVVRELVARHAQEARGRVHPGIGARVTPSGAP